MLALDGAQVLLSGMLRALSTSFDLTLVNGRERLPALGAR